ncbi:MAG: V-type ATP synthase subunit I [Methanoregulaceae archaeon]
MFKPEQMSRLLIAASKEQMEPVIRELYRHNLFHIEEFVEQGKETYTGFRIGTPLAGASEKSGELIKIRSIANAFSLKKEEMEASGKERSSAIKTKIESDLPALEREIEDLIAERSKLDAQVKEAEGKIEMLRPFAGIPVDMELYRGYRSLAVFAGYIKTDVPIAAPHEKYFAPSKEASFIVVFTPVQHAKEVENALFPAGFQSVPVPEETGPAQARIDHLNSQAASARSQMESITKKLDEIKTGRSEFLMACEELLSSDVEQAEAPLRFATTAQTFVAEGWVPTAKLAEVTESLNRVTGGKIFTSEIEVDLEHDSVPVEYHNPDFAKPTQMLMDVYSRPRYTEVDPTLMVSIVFPVFFGLILGDVGYGLILLVMCFGLRKFLKGEEGKMLLVSLRNASIITIIFGLLFSEFLGFELPWHPLIFSRHLGIGGEAGASDAAIPALLVLSVWIGVLHITLGRGLGMVNHARQDHGEHRMKAVLANFGWLAVMWGILIAIWANFAIPYMIDLTGLPVIAAGITLGALIGGILILVGVICIARESALELVELPTIISHVLSYTRLVAVGLSSVAIAMVVNYMSIGMFIEPSLENFSLMSIVMIIVGILVFLIGHAMNTALGILGGGLHSIRLHYVEFFTKFYKGGGKKYNPFGMKRRFTEE